MTQQKERNWTTDQRRAIDEVESGLKRALAESRDKLRAAGVTEEEGPYCLRCWCPAFLRKVEDPDGLPSKFGEKPSANPCVRLGCGHDWTQHYVY